MPPFSRKPTVPRYPASLFCPGCDEAILRHCINNKCNQFSCERCKTTVHVAAAGSGKWRVVRSRDTTIPPEDRSKPKKAT